MSRIVFLTAATLNPGMMKHGKVVDIYHLHVSLAHAHASVLQGTARQHSFRLIGELVSCSACSMAKGNRAPTTHHTTARAKKPMELIHIDTAGPFSASLGGSRYVVMFVDSASRLQRPYGTRDKSAAAILAVVKRLIAAMGVPEHLETMTEQSTQIIRSWNTATPRDPTRVDSTVHASSKWSRGERTLESLQGRARGTSGDFKNLPGHPRERGQRFYERGSDEFMDAVTAVGLGVFQSVGYRGK